ncbi:MAG: MBOAT family O-acyltransferase, partial [Gemmatimonadota bacterium]|nr:MBOAT family O-acyltransferase [Gemmatimonadota bacterium]
RFLALIVFSTVLDFAVGRGLARTASRPARRALLLASLLGNLGMLAVFKYAGFFSESLAGLVGQFGVTLDTITLDIILPVGISFYTFQTLSYTIDVYRGRQEPWDDFLDFALFVTFFPQLVAGPIVRARNLLPQFVEPKRASAAQLGWGLALLTTGLFQKIVLADGLMAPIVDTVYADVSRIGTLDAWIGTMAFASQIFLDFSGYSLCGIGAALCLGFVLPDNFRFPMGSVGFSDFWRRWHITLSAWMRDYVFIPLARRMPSGGPGTAGAALVTMFVVGLWHGAAWGFVLWGTFMGVLLVAERLVMGALPAGDWRTGFLAQRLGNVLTIGFLTLGLSLFRAPRGLDGFTVMGAMVLGAPNQLELGAFNAVLGLTMLPLLMAAQTAVRHSSLEDAWARLPWWAKSALLTIMLVGLAIAPRNDRAFIYFQF